MREEIGKESSKRFPPDKINTANNTCITHCAKA